MIAAIEKVIPQLPADVKVIPGHGQLSNLDDVRAYLAMLKETTAIVQNGIKQKKTLDQLKQEKVLAAYQKWSGDFVKADQWIETVYNDLTGKKTEEFIKHN